MKYADAVVKNTDFYGGYFLNFNLISRGDTTAGNGRKKNIK